MPPLCIFQGFIPNPSLGSSTTSTIRIVLTSSGGALSALLTRIWRYLTPKHLGEQWGNHMRRNKQMGRSLSQAILCRTDGNFEKHPQNVWKVWELLSLGLVSHGPPRLTVMQVQLLIIQKPVAGARQGAVPNWLQKEEDNLLCSIQEGLGIKWEEMVTQFKYFLYFQKKQRTLSAYHKKGLIAH